MRMTITLTDEELLFLQDLQNLINSKKRFGQERCTLEDIVHECIKTAIYLGSTSPGGQEPDS
jgi:hypothetical protein